MLATAVQQAIANTALGGAHSVPFRPSQRTELPEAVFGPAETKGPNPHKGGKRFAAKQKKRATPFGQQSMLSGKFFVGSLASLMQILNLCIVQYADDVFGMHQIIFEIIYFEHPHPKAAIAQEV